MQDRGNILRFRDLAELARVRPEVKWVMYHCADGYSASVHVQDAVVKDSLIALKMDGDPIRVEHGFPARLLVPHLYGWKSAKWLTKIEFTEGYRDGYRESRAIMSEGTCRRKNVSKTAGENDSLGTTGTTMHILHPSYGLLSAGL